MGIKNFEFSRLIIGTMRLGDWGVKMDTASLESFVEECLALGLKDFDHADIYGDYTTEQDFGALLTIRPDLRDKIRLTTKCGIKMLSPNRPDHKIKSYDSSKLHILQSVENSLKVLKTDFIDLLLIHRPDFLMNPQELAEAFESLQKAGKVLHFGVSNFTTSQFELLHSYFPLVTNQIEISISHLQPFYDGSLDQCLKYNIVPTAWSPLGGGVLFQDTKDERVLRIRKTGMALAEKYEAQLDQILLAWLMKHPSGIIPVLGTSRISRVKSALAACNIKLSHEEWYELWQASVGTEVP